MRRRRSSKPWTSSGPTASEVLRAMIGADLQLAASGTAFDVGTYGPEYLALALGGVASGIVRQAHHVLDGWYRTELNRA